jgi:hypothetical protein
MGTRVLPIPRKKLVIAAPAAIAGRPGRRPDA